MQRRNEKTRKASRVSVIWFNKKCAENPDHQKSEKLHPQSKTGAIKQRGEGNLHLFQQEGGHGEREREDYSEEKGNNGHHSEIRQDFGEVYGDGKVI